MIGLGVLLAGGMGYLFVLIANLMRHSADPGAITRFTGSPMAAAGIFAILSIVLLFGIVCIVLGGWMVRYGWRNPKLKRIVWRFAVMFWLACMVVELIYFFYGDPQGLFILVPQMPMTVKASAG